jgi:hypothetical protein
LKACDLQRFTNIEREIDTVRIGFLSDLKHLPRFVRRLLVYATSWLLNDNPITKTGYYLAFLDKMEGLEIVEIDLRTRDLLHIRGHLPQVHEWTIAPRSFKLDPDSFEEAAEALRWPGREIVFMLSKLREPAKPGSAEERELAFWKSKKKSWFSAQVD